MAKTNGIEFKMFYNEINDWEGDDCHTGEEIYVNGDLYKEAWGLIPDNSTVKIKGGSALNNDGDVICSFSSYFKRWRKAQSHSTFIVTCPSEKVDLLVGMVEAIGGCEVK